MREFHVPDMSCGHCKDAIEKALVAIDPEADVEIDLDTRRVRVKSAEADGALITAMKSAGYDATRV